MAVWSIINKNDIEGSTRIDAEYYQPSILDAANAVLKSSHSTLGDLVKSGYRVVYENTKILTEEEVNRGKDCFFMQAANISSDGLSFDVENMGYVHEADWIRYPKGRVNQGEILIEVKGQAEKVAIVPTYVPERTLVSGTLYKLCLKKGLSHEYLFAYMSSRYGKLLRDRLKTNTLIAYVSKPDLYSIPVYLPNKKDEQDVIALVSEAYRLIQVSADLYSQAEVALLEDLGLKNIPLKNDLFYTTNLNEVKSQNRMDSDFYLPKYSIISDSICRKGFRKLGDFGKHLKVNVNITKDEYYNYIEIGDVDISSGDVTFNRLQDCDLPANAKLKISGGELIVSKVRPTRGAVAIIPSTYKDRFICSGAFSVYKVKSPEREYIQVYLRSPIGKALLGRPSTGTQYPTIVDDDVKNIIVPDLNCEVISFIAEKVDESHKQRKSAKSLLEEAKIKIEKMIEENIS